MSRYFLGIDTSCYTTSCAVVDDQGTLVGEARRLLQVQSGARGLRQSEMVFQHTRALPQLMAQLPDVPISAIGVSGYPRRTADSYMPAFLVGRGQGETLAKWLQVPLYIFSHQENHIYAAWRSLGEIPTAPFYSLHVSGGTTELLYSEPVTDSVCTFTTEWVGGAIDLHGGQFVDRVGVKLGLPFPAGPHMERAAQGVTEFQPLPVAVKHCDISFGGPCSEAMRRLDRLTKETVNQSVPSDEATLHRADDSHYSPTIISSYSRAVFDCLSRSLVKAIRHAWRQKPASRLIAVGGVMANGFLRDAIQELADKEGFRVDFAEPAYSSDNASGNAYGALVNFKRLHRTSCE